MLRRGICFTKAKKNRVEKGKESENMLNICLPELNGSDADVYVLIISTFANKHL